MVIFSLFLLAGQGNILIMDTLTHALSGMLVARATRKANTDTAQPQLPLYVRLWSGFLAAAFPDADFVTRYFGSLSYLEHHRGVTHSFLMLPLWALLLSLVFTLLWRRRYHWKMFYGLSALSLVVHILGDVITAYGTMVFAPLSDMRLAFPTTFIIDPYFTGIILLGLITGWIFKDRARRFAIFGLGGLVLYIGTQAFLHQQAAGVAQQQASKIDLLGAHVSALPQPGSPMHWKLIIEHQQQYHIAYLNLGQPLPAENQGESTRLWTRIMSLYRPVEELQWETVHRYGEGDTIVELAQEAWALPIFEVLHRFMRYPSLFDVESRSEGLCAWFVDQRFVLRGLRAPFRYGACRERQGEWQAYRYGDDKLIPLF